MGRLATTRMFAGVLAWRGERASCWISLESEFRGERRIANIGDINGCLIDIIVRIICNTQQELLTTNKDCNQWILEL